MTTSRSDSRATGGATLRPRVTGAITEATFAELAETGYARMSMEAIARRAGVGKAALYRRWSSKEVMLTELIADAIKQSIPPPPATGALHTDLREMIRSIRDQLANPLVSKVGPGLVAEANHSPALAGVLRTGIAVPRRAAARAVLRAAIDRGELSPGVDLELGIDLLVAPLGFRMLIMRGEVDEQYLETLTAAVEAGLKAAVR